MSPLRVNITVDKDGVVLYVRRDGRLVETGIAFYAPGDRGVRDAVRWARVDAGRRMSKAVR